MNCREFDAIAAALGRSEALDPGVREEGLAHAGDCPRCGARLDAERALTAAFAAASAESRESCAPDRLEHALLSAFRRRQPARRTRHAWLGWGALAATAAAVAAVAILATAGRAPQKVAPRPVAPMVETARAPVVIAIPAEPPPPRVAPAVRRRRRAAPESQPGFLRLPYTAGALPATEVWVARVRLSRAALAAAGLPVNMDRADEAVVADVAFAGDGTARAVRIIR